MRGPAVRGNVRLRLNRQQPAADDLLRCDDMQVYHGFGIDLFVAGARATLDDRAQSRA
jgi:hypothetical protein